MLFSESNTYFNGTVHAIGACKLADILTFKDNVLKLIFHCTVNG